MAEFDLDKMADRVVEKALDEFTYSGKTLREWIEIIVAQDLLAITELEKIKEKILEYHCIKCYGACENCHYYDCIEPKDVIKDLQIIDKRIKELKGDDNK